MNVDQLLASLESAGNLRERLGLVASHWSQIRKLPRAQRENLAIGMGSRWASRRIQRLMVADGELTEGERLARGALERFGTQDPAELRRIARQLRDGDTDGLEDVFVGALGSALDERAGEVAQEPDTQPPAVPMEDDDEAAPISHAEDRAEAAEALTAVLATVALERGAETLPETAAREPESETESVPEAAAEAEEPPPEIPEPVAETEPEPQAVEVEDRLMEAHAPAATGGWRQRRQVSARIRDRDYPSLDSALDAVAELSESDRRWCLGDLVEHWRPDPASLDRILDACPDDRTRSRLAGRALR